MLQRHTMILWAKAKNEDFNTTAIKTYNTLEALKEFGTELSPNYLTVWRKKDAKPFEWSYDNFAEVLKKRVNREGDIVFDDLGHTVSFFSSLVSGNSAGISMTVGISNPLFVNNLVVDLPLNLPIYNDNRTVETLIKVFKKCVNTFEPFCGCISNSVNMRQFERYLNDGLPGTVHWVNYFGEEIVNHLGAEKIEKSPMFCNEKLGNGRFLRLKEMAFDADSVEDIRLQDEANKYFGFYY